MKQYVIYSVIVGDIDNVRQPEVTDSRFDYILFTDNIQRKKIGIWDVRPISYDCENKRKLSRFPKCLPTKVLPEYKASLYMDANIQIATNLPYERTIELAEKQVSWAGMNHPDNIGVYEGMLNILNLGWVHDYEVLDWYCYLVRQGFMDKYNMFENNVIFRSHTPLVESIGEDWWNSMNKVTRDQFSLMYYLWKHNVPIVYFLPPTETIRFNTNNFIYTNHNPNKRVLKLGILEDLRKRSWKESPRKDEYYGSNFAHFAKYKHPRFMLCLWGLGLTFRYGWKALLTVAKRKINR